MSLNLTFEALISELNFSEYIAKDIEMAESIRRIPLAEKEPN